MIVRWMQLLFLLSMAPLMVGQNCAPVANAPAGDDNGIEEDDGPGDDNGGIDDGGDDPENDAGDDSGGDEDGTGEDDPIGDDNEAANLTEAQAQAVGASAEAASVLAQAAFAAQGGTAESGDSSQGVPGDVTFGVCPEITLSVASLYEFEVLVDFDPGCEPVEVEGYACSGNASGTINRTAGTFDLTFNDLRCNGSSIGGSADLTYSRGPDQVTLSGSWNLAAARDDAATFFTSGLGACAYHLDTQVLTVSSFTGTVSYGNSEYACTMENITIAYAENLSLVPSSGTITLSTDGVGTVTIVVNENSPTTGEVQVSINGSPYVTVDLDEL
jgi:hypothetical protein